MKIVATLSFIIVLHAVSNSLYAQSINDELSSKYLTSRMQDTTFLQKGKMIGQSPLFSYYQEKAGSMIVAVPKNENHYNMPVLKPSIAGMPMPNVYKRKEADTPK